MYIYIDRACMVNKHEATIRHVPYHEPPFPIPARITVLCDDCPDAA